MGASAAIWAPALASLGSAAISAMFAPEGQEIRSFAEGGAPELDPRATLRETLNTTRAFRDTLNRRLSQGVQLGAGSIVNQPPTFAGGGLPMPIGLHAMDPYYGRYLAGDLGDDTPRLPGRTFLPESWNPYMDPTAPSFPPVDPNNFHPPRGPDYPWGPRPPGPGTEGAPGPGPGSGPGGPVGPWPPNDPNPWPPPNDPDARPRQPYPPGPPRTPPPPRNPGDRVPLPPSTRPPRPGVQSASAFMQGDGGAGGDDLDQAMGAAELFMMSLLPSMAPGAGAGTGLSGQGGRPPMGQRAALARRRLSSGVR